MAHEPELTHAQRATLRWVKGWEPYAHHSNGDITVRVKDELLRIDKDGKYVGAEVAKPKFSLSDDLTAGIKTPQTPAKSTYTYKPYVSKTICEELPECCKPREVQAVFWDADHTIWDMAGTAASITGKLKKTDENTVVELTNHQVGSPYQKVENYGYQLTKTEQELLEGLSSEEKDFLLKELEKEHGTIRKEQPAEKPEAKEYVRTTIKLDPTFRQTLDELEKRGIPSSIISLNTPGSVKRIIAEFGLSNRFVEIRDSYENKGKVFQELSRKQGICPCNGMFVDDNRSNTDPVHEKCGLAIQIGKGKDIEKTIDILKYIKKGV